METGTVAKVVIGIALFATFGLLVAIAYAYVTNEASWLRIHRKLLVLVLGYGGDVAERLSAVWAGITAGVKSLQLEFDDDAVDAMNRKY